MSELATLEVIETSQEVAPREPTYHFWCDLHGWSACGRKSAPTSEPGGLDAPSHLKCVVCLDQISAYGTWFFCRTCRGGDA